MTLSRIFPLVFIGLGSLVGLAIGGVQENQINLFLGQAASLPAENSEEPELRVASRELESRANPAAGNRLQFRNNTPTGQGPRLLTQPAQTQPQPASQPARQSPLLAPVTPSPTAAPAANVSAGSQPANTPKIGQGYAHDKVDPVATNGAIFENWPKPRFTLVISGQQDGYIEPCGCAGLENQKGGFARKHTLIKQLEAEGWNPIPLDLGGLVKRYGRQQEIKYHSLVDGLKTMGYQAIGLGAEDLRLPSEIVFAAAASVDADTTPFVSANVTIYDESIIPRYKIIDAAGRKVGVTAILGKEHHRAIGADGVELKDPVVALKPVVQALLAQRCDVMVLLSYASKQESAELAKAFPQFHFVVTAGGAEEPPGTLESVTGSRSLLVEVGHKGMYSAVLGFYDDRTTPLRYQRVPLDHRFEDADEMKRLMADYQEQLKALGFEGLGLKPVPHPSGLTFVGSEKCSSCHTNAHDKWIDTAHAHATDSLVKMEIPRQYDPECLSCHATGWEPQRYFPFASGFTSLTETPHLVANGCENCHGPGSAHVAAETAAEDGSPEVSLTQLHDLRSHMRISRSADACMQCHDLDNSPEFVKDGGFEKYWPKVQHFGKH